MQTAPFRRSLFVAAMLAMPVAALAQPAPTPTPEPAPAPAPASAAPHLAVASVRLNDAVRASKIIGQSVVNDHNEAIGSIDDLMIVDRNRIAYAVVSVGGFLGIGSKLVAVPYDQLQPGSNGHLTWPGASKQSLNEKPNFTYGS